MLVVSNFGRFYITGHYRGSIFRKVECIIGKNLNRCGSDLLQDTIHHLLVGAVRKTTTDL